MPWLVLQHFTTMFTIFYHMFRGGKETNNPGDTPFVTFRFANLKSLAGYTIHSPSFQ